MNQSSDFHQIYVLQTFIIKHSFSLGFRHYHRCDIYNEERVSEKSLGLV